MRNIPSGIVILNANDEPVYCNNWVKEMLPEQSLRLSAHDSPLHTDSPGLDLHTAHASVLVYEHD